MEQHDPEGQSLKGNAAPSGKRNLFVGCYPKQPTATPITTFTHSIHWSPKIWLLSNIQQINYHILLRAYGNTALSYSFLQHNTVQF